MTFNDFEKTYGYQHHTYPVFSQDLMTEGSFKRFLPMPGPQEVFDYALMGLPKYLPLTQETITPQGFVLTQPKTMMDGTVRPIGTVTTSIDVADYLTSAVTEIEMDLDCQLSETIHNHDEDYVYDKFRSGFMGTKLTRWPATEILQILLKFPHAKNPTNELYQTYEIPAQWIYLRRNKVNVVASIGSVTSKRYGGNRAADGGFFAFITGLGRGVYSPGKIEIVYKSGFNSDRLPAVVADMIKTWAARRYLSDVGSVLFPNNSVNVSIDGISQSASYDVQRLVTQRAEELEKKAYEQKRIFKKQFGNTVNMSFIGT